MTTALKGEERISGPLNEFTGLLAFSVGVFTTCSAIMIGQTALTQLVAIPAISGLLVPIGGIGATAMIVIVTFTSSAFILGVLNYIAAPRLLNYSKFTTLGLGS